MTDRPIDPREIISAVLTCSRRWNLGPAEEPLERVTMGDMVRYAIHRGPVDDEDKAEAVRIAIEVAAWKEGQR